MLEIEVKVRVKDPAAARQALLGSDAVLEKDRHLEDNTLFDFPGRSLHAKKCALRLRRAGRKIFLTFKGTPQKSRRFKVRPEHETELKNEKELRRIFSFLGLHSTFRYQKFRTTFRRGRLKISLDETAAGNFLEFEGQRSDIIKYAKSLGFSAADLIKRDYVEILQGEKGKL
ncbi:MAG: class IV adenylate cyclase [Acidobacteriota bacterium]